VEVEMDRIVTSSKSQIVQSSRRRDSGCRSSIRGLCDERFNSEMGRKVVKKYEMKTEGLCLMKRLRGFEVGPHQRRSRQKCRLAACREDIYMNLSILVYSILLLVLS